MNVSGDIGVLRRTGKHRLQRSRIRNRDLMQVSAEFRITRESHRSNDAESSRSVRSQLLSQSTDTQEEEIVRILYQWTNQFLLIWRQATDALVPVENRHAIFFSIFLATHC
jgi:hypothetical protein